MSSSASPPYVGVTCDRWHCSSPGTDDKGACPFGSLRGRSDFAVRKVGRSTGYQHEAVGPASVQRGRQEVEGEAHGIEHDDAGCEDRSRDVPMARREHPVTSQDERESRPGTVDASDANILPSREESSEVLCGPVPLEIAFREEEMGDRDDHLTLGREHSFDLVNGTDWVIDEMERLAAEDGSERAGSERQR